MVSRASESAFLLWERTFGNATSESEFGQHNGLTIEIQGARCKIERDPQIFAGGPGIFTVPIYLKFTL